MKVIFSDFLDSVTVIVTQVSVTFSSRDTSLDNVTVSVQCMCTGLGFADYWSPKSDNLT